MFPTARGREDIDRRPGRRHRRLRAASVGAILVSALLGAASIVTAQVPSSRSSEPLDFRPVSITTGAASGAPRDAPLAPDPAHASASRLSPASDVGDFVPRTLEPEAQREAYGQPDVQPETDARAQSKLPPTKLRARGTATWYCEDGVSPCHYAKSGGMYAAAGSEIRVGDWRGRTVTVCAGDECIRVTLIDWCACAGDRVIDLYGDAFRKLAPLGEGVIPVTIRW
jgi:hypothetical protein